MVCVLALQRHRAGHLCNAVAVDVHGIHGTEPGHLSGNAGNGGKHQICQFSAPESQYVRNGPRTVRHAGDEQGGVAGPQRAHGDLSLLAQLRHGHGHQHAGPQRQRAVFRHIAVRNALTVLIGPEHRQLPFAVFIQVRHGIFHIIGPHQFPCAVRLQGVDRQRLQIHADPPAHDDLHTAVAVNIAVIHAVNRQTAALNDRRLPVAVVIIRRKYMDLQGLFPITLAEESQCLLPAVTVQIHHLHRLDIAAGHRGGIFRATFLDSAELLV